MTEPFPLLAFGPPTVGPIPTGPPQFSPPPRSPSPQRQGERITPQFEALTQALDQQRAEATVDTAEQDPELVAVFDLVDTVDGFMRAVRDIDGLEFLVELLDEPIEPDEDFYHVDRDGEPTEDKVQETLYVVMSNAQAVGELVRLFELWQADKNVTFPRGYAPLKQAFVLLRAVRRWGPADRVRESGLLDLWREDVEAIGQQGSARVEIELWFRADSEKRTAAQASIEQVIRRSDGSVLRSSVVPEIEYHGILADIPYAQVDAVLQEGATAIELLTSEEVMLVSPAQTLAVKGAQPPTSHVDASAFGEIPTAPPRIALLDGLPLANHVALAGRLIVDDPDDLASNYSVGSQLHGTAMASVISHGDLSDIGPALSTTLYVRPILEKHGFHPDVEVVPPGELLVDLIHRAFRRMFEADGERPPAAPSVRIVNLSIGDPARVFVRRISPVAKLLDWLSHRYNVLMIVSAGNHGFQPEIEAGSLDDEEALAAAVLRSRFDGSRRLGLLSPAESINALTVGATHADLAEAPRSDSVIDAIPFGLPAAYGSSGFGHRRSVKPEVLLPGGRRLYRRPLDASADGLVQLVEAEHSAVGPGVRVAAPSPGGGPTGTSFTCGTSNAAAFASRSANQIFDVLLDQTDSDVYPMPDAQYHPVVAKAMLVHAAGWGDEGRRLRDAFDLDPRSWRRDLTQLLGYGSIDQDRVATSTRTRVVLLSAGSIVDKQRHTYRMPLPGGLAATTDWRRLTVTLAWLSPINARSRLHRQARLRVHPPDGQLGGDRVEADASAARMGTVQHELFEGSRALAFAAGDGVEINIDCRADAGKLEHPVRYGLAVSIEMATTVRVDLHEQVKTALQAEVRARAQVANR